MIANEFHVQIQDVFCNVTCNGSQIQLDENSRYGKSNDISDSLFELTIDLASLCRLTIT